MDVQYKYCFMQILFIFPEQICMHVHNSDTVCVRECVRCVIRVMFPWKCWNTAGFSYS